MWRGAKRLFSECPETLSDEVLGKMGAIEAKTSIGHIPMATVDDLPEFDATIFGTPTRFGNMCAEMRQYLEETGGLSVMEVLVGKGGSVFASSATQHGGQESTILSCHTTLLQGMIVVGLQYQIAGQMGVSEITVCSPYGASPLLVGRGSGCQARMNLPEAAFSGRM